MLVADDVLQDLKEAGTPVEDIDRIKTDPVRTYHTGSYMAIQRYYTSSALGHCPEKRSTADNLGVTFSCVCI